MSGLRIAMVTTFYPPYNFGGDGIAIQRLSRALVRRGHRVTVVHDADAWRLLAGGPDPDPDREPDGLEVRTLESRLGPVSPLLTHQSGRPVAHRDELEELLGGDRFDVIHYNNVSLVGGPGVLGIGSGLKVYEAHEHWLVCPSHVLWRHDREPCTGRECLRCVLNYRRPPQAWRYTGYLSEQLDHVDAFIAKSRFSREKHREFGFEREMEVVPYFLPDPEEGAGDPAGAPPRGDAPHPEPYFLFVGRLEKLKGLQEVIPVFEDYEGADLLVAGDGEYGPALRAMADGIDRVRFLGRVAPDHLDDYYRHARALVVPSVGFETFGIVIIEALRRGTPVIARDFGPFPEILERGGGLLYRGREELREAMERVRRDPGTREALSREAREAFLEHWTEDAVVPRYLDVIRRAAARKGLGRIGRVLDREQVA